MDKMITWVIVALGVLCFVACVCLLLALPFMWIWNYAVVSALTIAKPINYWVAFWLMLFVSFFFVSKNQSKS